MVLNVFIAKTRLQIFYWGTSRVCGRSLTLASLCFVPLTMQQLVIPNCFLWNPYRVILFTIAISHHPIRSHSGSMEQRCDGCDDDDAMVRQCDGRDTHGAIQHRFITLVLSYHRVIVIAPSSSHHRNI